MPADNPVVLAIVIVVDPAVVVPVKETGVGAPQLLDIVIVLVAPVAAVPRLAKNVSKASLDSLALDTSIVYLTFVQRTEAIE
jgi:hypothetical protein